MKIAMFQIMVALFLASLFLNTFMAGGYVLVMLSTGLMVGFALACGLTDKEPIILEPVVEANMLMDRLPEKEDKLGDIFKQHLDSIAWHVWGRSSAYEEIKSYLKSLEPEVFSVHDENTWIAMKLLGSGCRSFKNPYEAGKTIVVGKDFAERALILGFLP